MNTILKTAIASAILLGSAAAHALTLPSTGASDLVLFVQDTTKNTTYALDTGISISTILPTSSLVSGANMATVIAGLNQTLSATTTLSSFLNTTDAFVWGIQAGQYPTTANNADRTPGAASYIFTSAIGSSAPGNVAALTLANMNGVLTNLNSDYIALQTAIGTATDTNAAAWSTSAQSHYGQFGTSAADAAASLGSSIGLFGITGNGGTGAVQSYQLGSVQLTASGLTFTPNASSVPLPAAVWLLGSGLLGLFGVSRRRAA